MSFDLGQPWEDSGNYESAGPRLVHPSRSSSLNPSMSQRRKPLAVPQQCRRPVMGSSESREAHRATKRLSKQRPVGSSLVTGSSRSQDAFSPLGTSRYSQAYLAGSQGCLLLDQSQQESESSSSETQQPEKDNIAARRNKPELQLRRSALSKRSKSSTCLVGESPVFFDNLSPVHIPRRKSTVIRGPISPLSPVSPISPTSSRRHRSVLTIHICRWISCSHTCYSTDNHERQTTSTDASFAKLNLIPISPLNPNFLDEYQACPPTGTLKDEMFREPDFSSGTPKTSFEQPVSPVGGSRTSMPCIPMRRRSLIQTPGLATRPPPSNKLHEFADGLRSPTSIASILAGSADNQKEVCQPNMPSEANNSSARKVQKHLSLPNLPKMKEQERSVTPCESDYQQLGGMKFGTLRITNASPVPSSHRDGGEGQPTQTTATNSLRDGNHGVSRSQQGPHGPSNLSITNFSPSSTTDEPEITAQDIPKRSSSVPFNSGRSRPLSLLEKPRIEPTGKRLSSLMELIEEPRDDFGQEFMSVPSQTAPKSQYDQQPSMTTVMQDKTGVEYSVTEILDVRVDPSAKPVREDSESKAKNRAVRKVISSSDSGFVSATSSLSSRRTLSNSDSAYSSNASIQSKPAGLGSTSNEPSKPDMKHLRRVTDDHMKDSSHGSLISMSKSSIRRLSSRIRPRHSIHGISFSETAETPHGLSPDESSRMTNTPKSDTNTMQGGAVNLRTRATSVSYKTGKLQRLFAPPKKDDFSASFASHDIQSVPTVPFDVEERLREHSRVFPTTSMRLTKQSNRSEESLKTIISVESNADINVEYTESNYSRDSFYDESRYNDSSSSSRRSHKSHKSMNSMDSVRSLNSFTSSRTIKSIATSKSVQSSSIAQEFKNTKNFQIEASPLGPTYQAKDEERYSQRVASYAAISAVLPEKKVLREASLSRKPVPCARASPQLHTQTASSMMVSDTIQHRSQRILSDEPLIPNQGQNNYIATQEQSFPTEKQRRARVDSGLGAGELKAQISTPNLLTSFQTSAEVVLVSQRDLSTVDLTKELPLEPPRQPLLRSSFSRWSRGQDRIAERNWSWPQKSSLEDLRNYQFHPNQTHSQSTTVLVQEQRRGPQDILALTSKRRHSTLIHRPAFSESLAVASLKRPKKGPKGPYRILHSYNSPAYKNIPIWG